MGQTPVDIHTNALVVDGSRTRFQQLGNQWESPRPNCQLWNEIPEPGLGSPAKSSKLMRLLAEDFLDKIRAESIHRVGMWIRNLAEIEL